MIKWFAYIVLLLLITPALSFARSKQPQFSKRDSAMVISYNKILADTIITKTKKQEREDKKKVKEVAKAKKQPKPEKIESGDNTNANTKEKPKRQRRPEGLVRPPEIPRRNGN